MPNASSPATSAAPRGRWGADGGPPRGRPPAAHPAPQRDRVRPAALWTAVFGVPALWSVQMLVGYSLIAHSCYPKRDPLAQLPSRAPWVVALVVSLLALAGALGVLAVAVRNWRRTRSENHGEDPAGEEATSVGEVGEGRTRFMAFAGLLMSGLFLLGIVYGTIPLFVVPPCR